jgi:uncharacterized protein
MSSVQSALYSGWVRHRRFGPAAHAFRYPVVLTYLDLAELGDVFAGRWGWSTRRPALAWFRRGDFLGPAHVPLDTAVRDLVHARTGVRPSGPIRLLTQLRFLGFSFNPVSFYYVFDEAGAHVETIVAEITNTPWRERHAYVLPIREAARAGTRSWRFEFDKRFHVSPFMPMEQRYRWWFGAPGSGLLVHMQNLEGTNRRPLFDATLRLERREICGRSLAAALLRFPLGPVRVLALIYWQALWLLLKRVPFHVHPTKRPAAT